MTSHHDVAGVVAELRNFGSGDTLAFVNTSKLAIAATILEKQAKALSEAEQSKRGGFAFWKNIARIFCQRAKSERARVLAAEARLADLSRAMTEVRDWLILAGDMTCREIPLGIIARAFTNAAKEKT